MYIIEIKKVEEWNGYVKEQSDKTDVRADCWTAIHSRWVDYHINEWACGKISNSEFVSPRSVKNLSEIKTDTGCLRAFVR